MTRPPRVVSLVPSATETLLALEADVVACTRFCEQPDLVHVGGTKNPDIDAIVALGPDVVVLDREENRREDAEALAAAGLETFVTDVTTVDDALDVVVGLGGLTGGRADRAVLPEIPVGRRLTAFVPIWRRPWMTINGCTYGASLLAHVGIDLVTHGDDEVYPTVELATMAERNPSVVLVPSEPYVFDDRHLAELSTEFEAPVIRVDGQDLFWWGIRTPAALDRLSRAVTSW